MAVKEHRSTMDCMDQNPYESPESSPEAEKRSEKSGPSWLGFLALLWAIPVVANIISMSVTARPVTASSVLTAVVVTVVGVTLLLWIARRIL